MSVRFRNIVQFVLELLNNVVFHGFNFFEEVRHIFFIFGLEITSVDNLIDLDILLLDFFLDGR